MITVSDLHDVATRLVCDANVPNAEIGRQGFARPQPALNLNTSALPPYLQDDRLAASQLNYVPFGGKTVDITHHNLARICGEYQERKKLGEGAAERRPAAP